jgi:ElaB/YqjD/DUF883 family membrane-anchored ribosome-binding protein
METHFEGMESETTVSRQKIKEDIRTLLHDAEELLKITAGDMSEKAKEARARLGTAMQNARETCKKLEAKTAAAMKATAKCIREHPYQSMGVAFGIGLVVGLLISRK